MSVAMRQNNSGTVSVTVPWSFFVKYRPRSTSFASADSRGTGDVGGADDGRAGKERMRHYSRRRPGLTICAARCRGLHLQAVGTQNAPRSSAMRSHREELWFETKTRRAYINITRQVESVVKNSGVQEGLVLVNAM